MKKKTVTCIGTILYKPPYRASCQTVRYRDSATDKEIPAGLL